MAPHIPQMRQNIAKALKISEDQINVKATTEEGLGFTGEGCRHLISGYLSVGSKLAISVEEM